MKTILILFVFLSIVRDKAAGDFFQLSVVHLNDFHARFGEISPSLGPCKDESTCIGGFARITTLINQMKSYKNFILLNAGDNYQGTLWYNLFKWNVTQHFLNKLPTDAFTFGNHEFDDNITGLIPFIKSLNAPFVASNVDASDQPNFQNMFSKSIVIEREGKKIGIIGAVLSSYNLLSFTENLKFLDEVDSVIAEAKRLVEEEKVFTNIVLSHCGYDVDKLIAEDAKYKISLVVGGHSHSLLYTGIPPDDQEAVGLYPTEVLNNDNMTTLVVQASAFTQYLGNITVFYNDNGDVQSWEGNPIYLGNNITQDPDILSELKLWKVALDEVEQTVYGETLTTLSISNCYKQECNIGNFVTDAMIHAWKDKAENGSWAYAAIAMVNAGAIKSDITKGNITYADLATTQPWENTYDVIILKGSDIKTLMEYATRSHYYNSTEHDMYLLQVSGIKVVYNMNASIGSRVKSIQVRCQKCPVPNYEPIEMDKDYRVVASSYLMIGRDSFGIIIHKLVNIEKGPKDVDVLINYVKDHTPINTTVEDRIVLVRE